MTGIVPHEYKPCSKKCAACDNFVASQSYLISNATGRKYYKRRDSTCYMASCKKCEKQGVKSTSSRKPRLGNCESHIKKNARSRNMATHFIDECCDEEIPLKYLAFVIIDTVNNTSGLKVFRHVSLKSKFTLNFFSNRGGIYII